MCMDGGKCLQWVFFCAVRHAETYVKHERGEEKSFESNFAPLLKAVSQSLPIIIGGKGGKGDCMIKSVSESSSPRPGARLKVPQNQKV